MLDKFTGFFCFASFYIKSFFGAILKSPKWQEIALNISESSRRRTPDPPFLFIAYTMQSLPACLNINQAGWPRGPVPNLHCTCIFSIRRKALLGEQMKRKSLPRIHSLPRDHPLTAGWCNESSHSDSMTYLTSPPFLTCLSAYLFTPLTLHLLLPLSEQQPKL